MTHVSERDTATQCGQLTGLAHLSVCDGWAKESGPSRVLLFLFFFFPYLILDPITYSNPNLVLGFKLKIQYTINNRTLVCIILPFVN
jgi:hypothetical protein